jgi:hypothetical protein
VIAITDGIPVHDMARIRRELVGSKTRVVGPSFRCRRSRRAGREGGAAGRNRHMNP